MYVFTDCQRNDGRKDSQRSSTHDMGQPNTLPELLWKTLPRTYQDRYYTSVCTGTSWRRGVCYKYCQWIVSRVKYSKDFFVYFIPLSLTRVLTHSKFFVFLFFVVFRCLFLLDSSFFSFLHHHHLLLLLSFLNLLFFRLLRLLLLPLLLLSSPSNFS